jgi:hypothetical protein
MKKFFFDLTTPKGCFYDYQGQTLDVADAYKLAQLIALDLESTTSFDWMGAAVKIRDAHGKTLSSVPVQEMNLVAA